MSRFKILLLMLLFVFGGCKSNDFVGSCSDGKKELFVKMLDGSGKNFCVEVADNNISRATGLMGREKIGDNEGMLFVFSAEYYQSFWMKNTLLPLDLLFFDKEKKMVDYKDDFMPCTDSYCPSYVSKNKAMYVLEIKSNVVEGNSVEKFEM